jgi:hypothetical protein
LRDTGAILLSQPEWNANNLSESGLESEPTTHHRCDRLPVTSLGLFSVLGQRLHYEKSV